MIDFPAVLVEPALDNNIVHPGEPEADISFVRPTEIVRLREAIGEYLAGRLDADSFRRFRLQNGVYGMRNLVNIQMVRVKIPLGRVTAAQLQALGRVAAAYAGGKGHFTTRQDIQLYGVPLECVPDVLAALAEVGLTSRETSGNVVRNVTVDPLAGVARDEAFDVRPHANAVVRYFLRNPISQNMPRKVKIAFSGSPADRSSTAIHDIGALAVTREGEGGSERGFEIRVGGGLGSAPRVAALLEAFTPEGDLLPTVEAVIRVFDRLGNRQNRGRARLKYLVEQLGFEAFRDLVLKERATLTILQPDAYPELRKNIHEIGWVSALWPSVGPHDNADAAQAPRGNGNGNGHKCVQDAAAYGRWLSGNVVYQKQPGFVSVYIALPGGDAGEVQLAGLAEIARRFGRGELFATITQNLALRWVPGGALHELYSALAEIGLAAAGVNRVWNVVGCAGADTCNTAITTSHQLVLELARRLEKRHDLNFAPDLQGMDIKVGGCPNACGHHPVAAIGLYGGARRINGIQTPHYLMLLGGRVEGGAAVMGSPVTSIPAQRVPEAVERVIELYRAGRRAEDETFHQWLDRVGAASLKSQFDDLRQLPNPEVDAALYWDWGQDHPFQLQVGEAECAM